MAIRCFKKCGELCQRNIAGTVVTLMGIASVAALIFVLIR